MNEPLTATMTEVRRHLADTIERACRDHTPTFVTRRGTTTAVLIDADEYRRLLEIERAALRKETDTASKERLERLEQENTALVQGLRRVEARLADDTGRREILARDLCAPAG